MTSTYSDSLVRNVGPLFLNCRIVVHQTECNPLNAGVKEVRRAMATAFA